VARLGRHGRRRERRFRDCESRLWGGDSRQLALGTNPPIRRSVSDRTVLLTAIAMPSQRYYRQRARTLLAWSRATKDKAYAAQLRLRAANELEQAEHAREAVTDLNPLLSEFNAGQMRKEGKEG